MSAASEPLAADRACAQSLMPVSRETAARLDRFVATLLAWQQRINLIAPSTIPKLWTRHIADSLQLLAIAPNAKHWVDLGSGGGFPGLVIACALAEVADARVHLVESNGKKAAFLREAARLTGAPVTVHAIRIADFSASLAEPVDVITARALAPLNELLGMAHPLLKTGATQGLFLKGADVAAELTEAGKSWNIEASLVPSRTDPKARIVRMMHIEPKIQLLREAPLPGASSGRERRR
jgi:16S rRNA (guanine527-N7)-methyltransferase